MKKQRFSILVINALVKLITGGSGNSTEPPVGIYRSGNVLEQFFMDCGIDMRIGMKGRVPATTATLRALYDQNDDAQLESLITNVADPRHYVESPQKGKAVIDYLNQVLEADGYFLRVIGGKAVVTAGKSGNATISAIASKSALLDFDTVQRDIERALESAKKDPEDAVTAACSLIESVCRSILTELNLPLPPRKDIDSLLRATQVPLGLSPGQTELPSEIEADVRQILSGLITVTKGVGAIRTHAGDAHGRERGFRRIDERIAHLAVHAASTAALFLIETWERKYPRALPLHAEEAEEIG